MFMISWMSNSCDLLGPLPSSQPLFFAVSNKNEYLSTCIRRRRLLVTVMTFFVWNYYFNPELVTVEFYTKQCIYVIYIAIRENIDVMFVLVDNWCHRYNHTIWKTNVCVIRTHNIFSHSFKHLKQCIIIIVFHWFID